MSKRLKRIRKFANEAAERAFWEKNDSTGYLHWKKAPPAQVVVGRAARYTLQDVHNTLFPKGATQRKACGREGGNPDVHPQTAWAHTGDAPACGAGLRISRSESRQTPAAAPRACS